MCATINHVQPIPTYADNAKHLVATVAHAGVQASNVLTVQGLVTTCLNTLSQVAFGVT